ncbi:MAG: DNA topoisomerase [Candidatus Marinimicrobia bacterium]|jgi:DNA topoisomerase-2|nr:DNA topoisomerase [Candidatus Neomarinimicrobiota bacterium]
MKSIEDLVNNEFKSYSEYVLYNRAIPSMMDGFKSGQRKIVYTTNKVARHKLNKTASLAGAVISHANFHHGPASLEDAINGLVAPFNNNISLLEGEGSFGSRLVPAAAAARYTFTKLSNNFDKWFADFDVMPPMKDPEDPEPRFYLPLIPWVLVNGVQGISVGFATKIMPYDPKVLLKLVKARLKGKNIRGMKLIPQFPDFNGTVERIGSEIMVTGSYKVISPTKISITEVPPVFTREKYIEHLEKLASKGKISSYDDQCDENGFQFEVRMRKDPNIIPTFALKKVLHENITVIGENGKLKIYDNPYELIEDFVDARIKYVEQRLKFNINRDQTSLDLVIEKIRFITEVISGKINFKGKNKGEMVNTLTDMCYNNIDMLLKMNMYSLTKDNIDILKGMETTLIKELKHWNCTTAEIEYTEDLNKL